MQITSDDNEEVEQPKSIQVDFFEQLIRVSSNDSSSNIEDSNISEHVAHSVEFQPYIDPAYLIKQDQKDQKQVLELEKDLNSFNKSNNEQIFQHYTKNPSAIIPEIRMYNIIKLAQQQRIGGTYDYFATVVDKYNYHLLSRKIILTNITSMIDKNKIIKAHPVILLKEYFKNYVSLSVEFYQKSAKFVLPARQENDSRVINLSVQLRPGFDNLMNLRAKTSNEVARLEKYMKAIITKIDQLVLTYWNLVALYQQKSTAKRDVFQQRQKKFHKRIERIAKIYGEARIGQKISEDLFQQMLKFIKDQKQLRFSIYAWGMEILNLRNRIMEADRKFFSEFQSILSQFKKINNTIYQIKKKPFNFLDNLKKNIQENYYFQKLCTPLDADYIFNVYKGIQNSTISQLHEKEYENYVSKQYFEEVLGEQNNFLIGIIVKNFALKNNQQQLVKTISGNLIKYNKKTMQVMFKMKANNTSAELQGKGCVILKQKVKGIIFDSDHIETIYFMDDNRAEELFFFIGEQQ